MDENEFKRQLRTSLHVLKDWGRHNGRRVHRTTGVYFYSPDTDASKNELVRFNSPDGTQLTILAVKEVREYLARERALAEEAVLKRERREQEAFLSSFQGFD